MVDSFNSRRSEAAGDASHPRQKITDPAIIRRSWDRCREDYRLDRVERSEPMVVENTRLMECMDQFGEFVQQARAEMDNLYQQIAGSGYALLLTDATGLILDYVGNPHDKQAFQGAGLWLGAVWSEEYEGTNGVGTCIAERRPVVVHRDQHFRNRNHALSCTGAPILDSNGELFAVLDASSVNVRDTPASQFNTLSLVSMSAQLISKFRFFASFPNALILRFHSRQEYVGLINDAAMAIDGDGTILAADQNAVSSLGLTKRISLVGRSITDVMEITPTSLLEHARNTVMPYWTVRSLQGTRYFATVAQGHEQGLPGERVPTSAPGGPLSQAASTQSPVPRRARPDLDQLAGRDPGMQRHADRARRVAGRGIPVMLRGETGTGKEVFARAIHAASPHGDGPFVAVNCGAIPESLIESELFGYLPGAFTGARKGGMKGKVLLADKGTLFLDEIGDMPVDLQTRLLRVLEEHEVVPLGGETPVSVNINLISATHCDLAERVRDGRFREDLYYRLNGLQVELPPLRERQDRRELIRTILGEEGGADIGIADEVITRMMAYRWPGNLRQLRNVLRTSLALCDQQCIRVDDLGPEFRPAEGMDSAMAANRETSLESAERDALIDALMNNRWNVSRTAEALAMSRNTLYRKMRKHGIQGEQG